jgi:hypothetical protein
LNFSEATGIKSVRVARPEDVMNFVARMLLSGDAKEIRRADGSVPALAVEYGSKN